MARAFSYDSEFTLSVPEGTPLHAILVDIDLAPKSASCVIYGVMPDGRTEGVTVQGGHSQVCLPFVDSHIFVKHNGSPDHLWIGTIGHQ